MTVQPLRQAALKFADAALTNGGLSDAQIKDTLAHIIPGTRPNQSRLLAAIGFGTAARPFPEQDIRGALETGLTPFLRNGGANADVKRLVSDVVSASTQPSWQKLAFMPA